MLLLLVHQFDAFSIYSHLRKLSQLLLFSNSFVKSCHSNVGLSKFDSCTFLLFIKLLRRPFKSEAPWILFLLLSLRECDRSLRQSIFHIKAYVTQVKKVISQKSVAWKCRSKYACHRHQKNASYFKISLTKYCLMEVP